MKYTASSILLLVILLFSIVSLSISTSSLSTSYFNYTIQPDFSILQYDQFYLTIGTNIFDNDVNPIPSLENDSSIDIWYRNDACSLNCKFLLLTTLNSSYTIAPSIILNSAFGYSFEIKSNNLSFFLGSQVSSQNFKEYGDYLLSIYYNNNSTEVYTTINGSMRPTHLDTIPIIVMFSILFGLATTYILVTKLYKRHQEVSKLSYQEQLGGNGSGGNNSGNGSGADLGELGGEKKERLKSLDVFRGLSVTVMIFVNYGGGGYWYFNHSYWNGLTVADLVFPWFIFIMGIAMPFSISSLEKRGTPKIEILKKIVVRSVKLFALGLFLNNGTDLGHWRILGVLQRFSISYLVTGLILLYVPLWRPHKIIHSPLETYSLLDGNIQRKSISMATLIKDFSGNLFADIIPFWTQWIVAFMLLLVWFLVTFLLEVPGCPRGYLGPGGISDQGLYSECTGGAAKYVDLKIFTLNHIYQTPTCQPIYQTGAYDPEGTLGYLTSVFLCWLGVQAGRTILIYKSNKSRLLRWIIWSLVLCGIAAGLCGLSQNDGWIPVNKNLWTPTFVFLLAGFGFFMLFMMFIIIDIKKLWNGAPFIYVGMNPITIYCAHEILGGYFPLSFYMAVPSHALFLLSNCIGVSCWLIVAYLMYRYKIFINL